MKLQRPWVNPRSPVYRKTERVVQQEWPFQLGDTVSHDKFGLGTVVGFEGSGEHTRVQVNFQSAGAKWLVLAYAKLSPVQ